MGNKVLLTGSSGFLGSQLIKDLIFNNYKVTALDIIEPNEKLDEVEYLKTDLKNYLTNLDSLKDFELIIHAASVLPYKNNEKEIWDKNFSTTKKLVEQLEKKEGFFFIYVSSSAVYGKPLSLPIKKETLRNPLDVYGESKVHSEDYIVKNLNKESYAIIRPRTILGDNRSGIFDIFFKLIKMRIPLPIPNNGRQIIQFVEVRDLSNLIVHVAKTKLPGVWPAAGPTPEPLNYLLKSLSQKIRKRIIVININTKFFQYTGKILISLKITKFTSWHFGAFPHDFYFDNQWVPYGFKYKYTSNDAFFNNARKFFKI